MPLITKLERAPCQGWWLPIGFIKPEAIVCRLGDPVLEVKDLRLTVRGQVPV